MTPGEPANGPPGDVRVAGILLAGGGSRRLGRSKQLLDWHGEPLVRHAAKILLDSAASPRIAVLGDRASEVAAALDGLAIDHVVNPRWHEGQSTSVGAGIVALGQLCQGAASCAGKYRECDFQEYRGALFVPCDQPRLTAATLDLLIATFAAAPSAIIRPRYAGRPGAPVLFPAALFDQLTTLEGDEGGRQLLRQLLAEDPHAVLDVPIADTAEGFDLDTEEDLATLRSHP